MFLKIMLERLLKNNCNEKYGGGGGGDKSPH